MRQISGLQAERLALLFRQALQGHRLLPLERAELDAVAETGAVLELAGGISARIEPGSLMPWRDPGLAETVARKATQARRARCRMWATA